MMNDCTVVFTCSGWKVFKKAIETLKDISSVVLISVQYDHTNHLQHFVLETEDKERSSHMMYQIHNTCFVTTSDDNKTASDSDSEGESDGDGDIEMKQVSLYKFWVDIDIFESHMLTKAAKNIRKLVFQSASIIVCNQKIPHLPIESSSICLPQLSASPHALHNVVAIATSELGRMFCEMSVGIDDIFIECKPDKKQVHFYNNSHCFILQNIESKHNIKTGPLMLRLLIPLGELRTIMPKTSLDLYTDSLRVQWKNKYVSLYYAISNWHGYS